MRETDRLWRILQVAELWGARIFPLVKKNNNYAVAYPQLANVLENHRGAAQEKHLSFRGIPDQSLLAATIAPRKSVMSEVFHLVILYPLPTWPEE